MRQASTLLTPMARVGLYPAAPKPACVLGYEVAGEVESIGEGVSGSRSPRLGELNLPSVDDFDRQDLVAYAEPTHRGFQPVQIRSSS